MLKENTPDLQYEWGKIESCTENFSYKGVQFSKDGLFIVAIAESNTNVYKKIKVFD